MIDWEQMPAGIQQNLYSGEERVKTMNSMKKFSTKVNVSQILILLLLMVMGVLAGCGSQATSPPNEVAPKEGVVIIEKKVEVKPPVEVVKESDKVVEVEKEVVVEREIEPVATPIPTSLPAVVEQRQADPLRAGATDDNAQWDDYLAYRQNYRGPVVHDRDINERYIIAVQDARGYPVMDAAVRIFYNGQQQNAEIYQARTYANGQVLFHPRALGISSRDADSFLVVVSKNNVVTKFTVPRNVWGDTWVAKLDMVQRFDAMNLDVLFLLDSTGSMADEIDAIQRTIFSVSERIDQLPGQTNVRFGYVTYRDRGDEYVSKIYDFDSDVSDFSTYLNTVQANGGGDYPESLNEALHHALDRVHWGDENTVRLVFLVADAPPHLDYVEDYDYADEMDIAARQAIKIFPIASSGLDDQGEYIFRQLAQYTQGRFVFLTYDTPSNSGSPGDVTTHHVDSYSVSNLDDLLVHLVTEELAYQSPALVQMQ